MITIRLQTPDDLEVADEIGRSAFGPSRTIGDTYRLAQTAQPDGCFLAVEDGDAVGTATVVGYGPFCYIGAMCVRAERQGRGIGRALLERVLSWKEERGIAVARLDASNAGAPLYRQFGFREIGGAFRFRRRAGSGKEGAGPEVEAAGHSIHPLTEAHLGALLELDRRVFGGDREAIFRALLRLFPGRAFVSLTEEGEVAGFLCCQGARIGPWVARDPGAAKPLLRRALELPFRGPPSLSTPVRNPDARALLEAEGFEAADTSAYMALGTSAPAGERSRVFAQTSFALG